MYNQIKPDGSLVQTEKNKSALITSDMLLRAIDDRELAVVDLCCSSSSCHLLVRFSILLAISLRENAVTTLSPGSDLQHIQYKQSLKVHKVTNLVRIMTCLCSYDLIRSVKLKKAYPWRWPFSLFLETA